MKTFKEFYEEQEIVEESFGAVIGKLFGIGGAGLLFAWISSLLFKGGVHVVNSFANTLDKANKINFKNNFKSASDSPSIKDQVNKSEELKKRYAEFVDPILEKIREKDWGGAAKEYNELPADKKNSTEIRRIIIEAVIYETKTIPISDPTPGNECYRAIKAIMGLAAAKAISKAIQEQATKYVQEKGV